MLSAHTAFQKLSQTTVAHVCAMYQHSVLLNSGKCTAQLPQLITTSKALPRLYALCGRALLEAAAIALSIYRRSSDKLLTLMAYN